MSDVTDTPPPVDTDVAAVATKRRSTKRDRKREKAMTSASVGGFRDRITVRRIAASVAALTALILVVTAVSDRRETVTAVVARDRIPAGTTITSDLVEVVEIPASGSFEGALVVETDLDPAPVANRTLEPGEPLVQSSIGSSADTRRIGQVLPIPIDDWSLTGGPLEVGDFINVIDTSGESTRFVITDAAVIARSAGSSGGNGLGASGEELWVSIEVDDDQALDLAGVIARDEFLIARAANPEVGE